jgi:hypothetical protein
MATVKRPIRRTGDVGPFHRGEMTRGTAEIRGFLGEAMTALGFKLQAPARAALIEAIRAIRKGEVHDEGISARWVHKYQGKIVSIFVRDNRLQQSNGKT